jgi:streptomycin 6-kinase
VRIPSELARAVADWKGDVARLWVEALPDTIATAERRWGITIERPYEPGGYTSYVAPAMAASGVEVVYKCAIPHDEAVGEAEALRIYDGDGAVRLLESEPATYELLLEPCTPGRPLWDIADEAQRVGIATSLMRRLWREVDDSEFITLDTMASSWADITERRLITMELPWVSEPIERGIDLLRTLPFADDRSVLLHQDLHPGNILAAEREPWLVIDPKPVVGDPAFDPVQLLVQASGHTPEPPEADVIVGRMASLADRLGLDAERIGLWAIARCAEWSMWSFDHGNTVDAAIEYSWARVLDTIIPG